MRRSKYVPKRQRVSEQIPFSSAEEAWFWFIRCQRLRRDGARPEGRPDSICRPCEPDDLPRAAKSLWRSRIIGRPHLSVLERFGCLDRPPDARCREEEVPARLWDEVLDRLTTVLKAKGIVQ